MTRCGPRVLVTRSPDTMANDRCARRSLPATAGGVWAGAVMARHSSRPTAAASRPGCGRRVLMVRGPLRGHDGARRCWRFGGAEPLPAIILCFGLLASVETVKVVLVARIGR